MRGLIGVLVAVLVGSAIAIPAYYAGLAQGGVPAGAAVPPAYYYGGWHFGFFGFIFPILFFFLFIGLIRGLFGWGHGWRSHHNEWYGGGYPAPLEELHRRMHEEQAKPADRADTKGGGNTLRS